MKEKKRLRKKVSGRKKKLETWKERNRYIKVGQSKRDIKELPERQTEQYRYKRAT